jgi:mono/diheme cytochrome c family protein
MKNRPILSMKNHLLSAIYLILCCYSCEDSGSSSKSTQMKDQTVVNDQAIIKDQSSLNDQSVVDQSALNDQAIEDQSSSLNDQVLADQSSLNDQVLADQVLADQVLADQVIDQMLPPPIWQEEQDLLQLQRQLPLSRSAQVLGDVNAGWDYVRYGNFVAGGVPLSVFTTFIPPVTSNLLERTGDNATLPRSFNAFDASNGVRVVGGITCLGCHSSYLNGQFVVGLGNAFSDYTNQSELFAGTLKAILLQQYGENSPEYEASRSFLQGSQRVGGFVRTPFRGVNPAFKVEEVAVSMRNPNDLQWRGEEIFQISPNLYASDVPAWWHVKKKAALYYNAMGRGDFRKMLMQTSVVAIESIAQAEEILSHFDDMLAWIQSIQPPAYPQTIDQSKIEIGKAVFTANCSRCHGTYLDASDPSFSDLNVQNAQETYPNLLIALDEVGTDPYYARDASENAGLSRWLNDSWYANSEPRMQAFPLAGYVAPPLDGIWATAPYFHNGAVPNLKAVIDPSIRPNFWCRDFESDTYDFVNVGWPFTEMDDDLKNCYDTSKQGYGHMGHTYGVYLNESEKDALLEYLKGI